MRNSKALLFIIGTAALTLAACGADKQTHEQSPTQPYISSLSEKAADCEAKIVQQMKTKSILLKPVKGLEKEISEMNSAVQETQEVSYQVTKVSGQVSDLSIEHGLIGNFTKKSIEFSLSPADKHTAFDMLLSIYSMTVTKTSALTIKQSFGVNDKCELIVSETELNDIHQSDGNKVSMFNKKVFLEEDSSEYSKEVETPEGKQLSNFFNELTASKTPPKELKTEVVAYIPNVGLADIRLERTNELKKVHEFGLDLNLEIFRLDYSVRGTILGKAELGKDSQHEISVSINGKSRTWTINEQIFKSQRLGSVTSAANYLTSDLAESYLEKSNTIEMLGENKPTYKNFDAYWTLLSQRQESSGLTVFTYQENTDHTFRAEQKAADLKSNSTIQTDLPEIKKVAAQILKQAPQNRKMQIKLILQYLKENYSYDSEMAKSNTVRPLTTLEALKRGKGVCQHYAVIFVSIARALKIPSATVVGFSLLNGSAGGHAWVEAEIEPGIWTVIEPQQPDGLETTSTRFYIPTGRQGFLEDKDEMAQFIKEYNENIFTIRPVSN